MATRPSRLERITNLVLVLLDTSRPLSLREIGAEVSGYPAEHGALRQAFERDKRTLREGGIPIAVERIDGDDQVGYRILPEQYYLPELGLDEEEEEALGLALAAVRLEGALGADAGQKLGAPGVDLPPLAVLPALPALGTLQEALRQRATVRFAYRGKRRVVEGYGLAFKSGSWYLVGRDEGAGQHGELRTFRVDRIEDEPALGDPGTYDLPPDFDLAAQLRFLPWDRPGTDLGEGATDVVVDVDVREARAVTRLVGERAVLERHNDGSRRLSFSIGDEEAFVTWVLGLADAVEVVSPPELRVRVVERLRSLVAAHAR